MQFCEQMREIGWPFFLSLVREPSGYFGFPHSPSPKTLEHIEQSWNKEPSAFVDGLKNKEQRVGIN